MSFTRRMRSLPLSDIKIVDPFWARWQRVISESSLPSQFALLESTDRLENFRKAARGESGGHQGIYFNDSDVYKWLEASAYALANHDHLVLRSQVEEVIGLILAAQEDDGYLNTFFQLQHPELKYRNLAAMHEMYCGGHLIEAGVALFESLGDKRLLDACIKYADHLNEIFGPDRRVGYCGHEEIELALLKLAGATGDARYRALAKEMVYRRGIRPSIFEQELNEEVANSLSPGMSRLLNGRDGSYSGEYAQDHAPICEHDKVVGHAVRAMYLYVAAAEIAGDEKDSALGQALVDSWSNLTRRRMYITGGIGPSSANEGFTSDFDLPNLTAYAETCAACGLIFWGQSMLEQTGSGEYADVIERALYNGAISGISLDGTKYFYDNPLESRGGHARSPWFDCACCPPNVARLIGNLGAYVIGVGESDVYINQFAGFQAKFQVKGIAVNVNVESSFPWDGKISVSVEPESPVEFCLRVRIPEWAEDVATDLPGADEAEYEDGYAIFHKRWEKGDALSLEIEMNPTWMEAGPKVRDALGRTALSRGPIVYCAESLDNSFSPQTFSVDVEADVEIGWDERLEGVMVATALGYRMVEEESDDLYTPLGTTSEIDAEITMIPYYAWANRGKSDMQVWIRS